MAWIRIDDHFDEHPKFAKAGPLGIALWIAGLAYCNRTLTDGFIPWAVAQSLLTWRYLDPIAPFKDGGAQIWTIGVHSGNFGDDVTCDRVVEILVAVGLWDVVEGGYRIHDYEKYQPSKAQVLAEREAARNRMSGRRSGEVRPKIDGSSPAPVPVPVPVPVFPDPEPKDKSAVPAARSRFAPPSVEQVRDYCQDRHNHVDPQVFVDHYTSNGWRVGRNPMKDWRAAVRTWEKNGFGNGNGRTPAVPERKPDYTALQKARRDREEWERENSK